MIVVSLHSSRTRHSLHRDEVYFGSWFQSLQSIDSVAMGLCKGSILIISGNRRQSKTMHFIARAGTKKTKRKRSGFYDPPAC